jgi:asparagine synthase (glutamine-hydrolysing)
MCGIAGYFGPRAIEPERLEAALSLMGRRGPDHRAVRQWKGPAGRNAVLLHSRLKIIDLDERANQPFRDGGLWMALNGELYNYLEVKESLKGRAGAFATTSDTEVFIKAWGLEGPAVLDRCEGMWAFAVYDEADGSLHLCRDRFGEKPLYLYRDGGGLYFGSEVKFIAALLGRGLKPNIDQLCRFLVNGYKSLYKGRHTFYEGLEELPAASVLRIGPEGRESGWRYWTPAFRPDESMSYEAAVSGARERLLRAVELRLRADVPLAFCMSGGVDSNSLIATAKRVFKYDVHGFTIVNTDARYEESDLVEASVAELGVRHTAIPVQTTEFLPRLRELIRYHDAPVYTITYYAHWLLMKAVAEHGYRVSVSGTAADELFTGYYDHHLAYLYEVRGEPELHRVSMENWERHIKPIVRNPFLQDPDAFIKDPGMRGHIYLDSDAFGSFLREPWSEPFSETRYTDSLLRNRMLNELFHEATPVILHEDDLNAMYYSIENRSPFLDRPLFDFCFSIPSRHLVRDGMAKAVLRDAMKGIIPEPVRTSRRKVGFNAPIFSFLDVGDPAVRSEVLRDSPVYEHVKRSAVEALMAKPDLPNSESKFLFTFLCAKMFLEEFS